MESTNNYKITRLENNSYILISHKDYDVDNNKNKIVIQTLMEYLPENHKIFVFNYQKKKINPTN